MKILIIFLISIIILLLFINFFKNKEFFCPDLLTYNNYQYRLWNNNNVWAKFSNYYDYLKFYNFTQSNYTFKNKFCFPLLPIMEKKNHSKYNSYDKKWDTNREFRYNLRI